LIYLVFCDILCGCPRGGCGWRWPHTTRCLRTAIEAQEGFVFSHTGDEVVAAFASPKSAVDARRLRAGRASPRIRYRGCPPAWPCGRPSTTVAECDLPQRLSSSAGP